MNNSQRERDINRWGMILHLSQLSSFLVPLAGLVLPIIIWQIKRSELPEIDAHGKIVCNWIISTLIYGIAIFLVSFGLVALFIQVQGGAVFGAAILGLLMISASVVYILFPIIAAIKASNGELWNYPFSLKIF
jgi:uncharacterized protein